jgi:DNA polymerase III epsilon subunit-like protein
LPSHRLDVLLHHCKIPRPAGRHRALPDVEITVAVLLRILDDAAGRWTSLAQLRAVAGYQARANKPTQESLF